MELEQKREAMRPIHRDRLEKQGLQQIALYPPTPPRPPPPTPVEQYSIAEPPEEENYQSADEEEQPQGPSRTARALEGTKNLVKNHAWPFTRDILAPATAEATYHVTKGAAWLLGKSIWTLADILWALNAGKEGGSQPTPDDLGRPALGWGFRGGASSSSAPLPSGEGYDESYEDLSKRGKGYLVEEIYKQPGWARMFGREDSRGYTTDQTTEFRKKLGKMSPKDLADVLTKLKSSG